MRWLLWILLIVIVVVIFMKMKDQNKAPEEKDSPMDILKKRYARGEISKEEFDEIRRNLNG